MKFSRRTLAQLVHLIGADVFTNAELDVLYYEFRVDQFNEAHNTKLRRGLALVRGIEETLSPNDAEEAISNLILRALKTRKSSRQVLIAALEVDGLRYVDERLIPTTPAPAALGPQVSEFEKELEDRVQPVAARHYRQAVDNFEKGNFEACNGMMRSYLEAFLLGLATALTSTTPGSPKAALDLLRSKKKIDDEEWNIARYFWAGIQDNGPHAGLTERVEALFRLHAGTAIGRYLISKLS